MISTEKLIKKRILIVGSNGMLGQRLTKYFSQKENVELLCCSAEEKSYFPEIEYAQLDIRDKKQVKKIMRGFYPDFIINTAAYTNVDGCETNKELAWAVNVIGPENLAFYAHALDSHLIHISSDYVFDGENGPYSETDIPNPISYYGRTKLASENVIKGSRCKHTIIRTNVLYGPAKFGRPDFVKWVVTSLRNNEVIRIVVDQFNNPTYLDDLVYGISKIVDLKKEGIYNLAGEEILSRFEFAEKIADYFKLNHNLIKPITTAELNQLAKRPLKSGLIILKAQTELNYKPRTIEETFNLMKKELNL